MQFNNDNTKEQFVKQWPTGYCENWDVYGPKAANGLSEL